MRRPAAAAPSTAFASAQPSAAVTEPQGSEVCPARYLRRRSWIDSRFVTADSPEDWALQASDDGGSTWVTVDRVTNEYEDPPHSAPGDEGGKMAQGGPSARSAPQDVMAHRGDAHIPRAPPTGRVPGPQPLPLARRPRPWPRQRRRKPCGDPRAAIHDGGGASSALRGAGVGGCRHEHYGWPSALTQRP